MAGKRRYRARIEGCRRSLLLARETCAPERACQVHLAREHVLTLSDTSSETAKRHPRGEYFATFVANAQSMLIPERIVEKARLALIDHVAVGIGGIHEPAARGARAIADGWKAPGNAPVFLGPRTNASLAAFVNGTAAHCLDFDDTHAAGAGHISAPVWSTALAVAVDRGLDEQLALRGFIAGYEIMARLGHGGTRGIGKALQERGLHPTGINGVVGAAAAVSAMSGHDETMAANALGLAATSAAGLVGSFGTDAKPYHAGRSAWNGILAAELASKGLTASRSLFELNSGLLRAFIQDGSVEVPETSFEGWELDQNGYKPYACCRAAHASILAAQKLRGEIQGRTISRVHAKVHWSAQFTAGHTEPRTPLEAKFSVAYCIAAALSGYSMNICDFESPVLTEKEIRRLLPLIEIEPVRDQPQAEAYLEIWCQDGLHTRSETKCFLGHPENPMSIEQFETKFMSLVVPAMGESYAHRLFETVMQFERPGALQEISDMLSAG